VGAIPEAMDWRATPCMTPFCMMG